MQFLHITYKLSLYSNNANLYLKNKRQELRCLNRFIVDLFTSALITSIFYYLILATLYIQINSNSLRDPSQMLDLNSTCSTKASSNNLEYSTNYNDLSVLTNTLTNILSRNGQKHFVCYRTLFSFLRLKSKVSSNQNTIDLCLYDYTLNQISIYQNLLSLFGFSKLQRELENTKLLEYEFNHMFGYYKIKYHSATVYLYLFSHAPPTRMSFESVRRFGIIYTQFDHLIENIKLKNRLDGKNSYVNGNEKNVNVLNKLPIYMIENDNVEYRVKIGQSYFSLPIDPYDTLMYFYPSLWWKHFDNCTI